LWLLRYSGSIMNRRQFPLAAAAAGGALLSSSSMSAAAQSTSSSKTAIIELRYYHLRNGADNQRQRLSEFLAKQQLPALKRAGAVSMGVFGNTIGEKGPYLLQVSSYASPAALVDAAAKLAADEALVKESANFYNAPGLPYVRMEVQLLQAFDGMPQIEAPAGETGRAARIFELRTYESNTPLSLAKKIQMFEQGEIAIFRKTGLQPVFFGRMIAGPNMPNLTYMLCYDDLAARERNWRAFVSHPEWVKLRATPGWSDAEIVSNISNSILSPIQGSPIR